MQNINSKEKLEGSLAYEFPGNINIIKMPSGFAKDFNTAKKSLALDAGSILNFSFYLEPASEGKHPIQEKYKYSIKNVDYLFENTTYIDSIEPKPIIELISEYTQIKPGQKFIIVVKLKNPSKFYDLANIKASLNVPYNNEVIQSLFKLTTNQSYTIISNTFIAPQYLSQETDTLNINLLVEYSLNELPKSINKSLALKVGSQLPQQPATSQPQPAANQSEAATETQAAPAAQQETLNQSQQASAPAEIIEETLQTKKFKVDFSDKMLWVFVGIILIIVFVLPVVIYLIRKGKKPPIQEQKTLPQQQIQMPR